MWATSKHDVYLMQNYSVMHWSSMLRRGKEVLNVAKPIVPTLVSSDLVNQKKVKFLISISLVFLGVKFVFRTKTNLQCFCRSVLDFCLSCFPEYK